MTLARLLGVLLPAAGLLSAVALSPALALDISGAGATFPYPIYAKWAEAYRKETGIVVTYQPIGSGGGIRQIQNSTVTFGASDMPLKRVQLNKDGLVQFPTLIGGAVPVVNLEGVASGELKLDGATLAKIFLGEVKTWNDQPGAASWPATGATFILVHRQPKDPPAVAAALKFFAWAYAKGAKMAEDLDYVPLPKGLIMEIEKVWGSEITDASGKPLYAGAN